MDHGPATEESVERFASAWTLPQGGAVSHRAERPARLRVFANWPLLAVLAVQTALSLRLVGADTAFEDEAAYLWAGHLDWAHVLHGTPVPPFAFVLLRGAGSLPAAGCAGRQCRRPGRGPDSVARLHARGDRLAVGRHCPAVRAAFRLLRGRVVRCAGPDVASGIVRDL